MKEQHSMCERASPRVEFGSTRVEFVRATDIRDLRQIRQEYDAEELQTLADRIPVSDGSDGLSFQLINPPTIARFDDADLLGRYLDDHRRYYGLEAGVHDDIFVSGNAEGQWHIRVNGHRRGLAVEFKCRQQNIPLETVQVASTLILNPSFDEARQKQYVENTSSPIKAAEDAASLELEYVWRWNEHPSVPVDSPIRHARIRELADFTGHSTDKVRAALLYVTMPSDIRAFTSNGLSYSNVVALARLRDAYAAQRQDVEPKGSFEQGDQRMRDYFERTILRLLSGTNKATVGAAIEAKIKEVTKTAEYMTDELFFMDEEMARSAARSGVRKDIARAAVLALQFAELSPQDCEKILSIIGPKLTEQALDNTMDYGDVDLFSSE